MTDFAQTVTGTVTVFGQSDTEDWNEIVWGTDNWGFDNDQELEVGKLLANTCNLTTVMKKDATNSYGSTATVASTYVTITQSDTLGYVYIYPSDTTNILAIASSVFTNITNASLDIF